MRLQNIVFCSLLAVTLILPAFAWSDDEDITESGEATENLPAITRSVESHQDKAAESKGTPVTPQKFEARVGNLAGTTSANKIGYIGDDHGDVQNAITLAID